MAPATFRNPQGTSDSASQEHSPLLGTSNNSEDSASMPTKRALLAHNLFGGSRALATQVSWVRCRDRSDYRGSSNSLFDRFHWSTLIMFDMASIDWMFDALGACSCGYYTKSSR